MSLKTSSVLVVSPMGTTTGFKQSLYLSEMLLAGSRVEAGLDHQK